MAVAADSAKQVVPTITASASRTSLFGPVPGAAASCTRASLDPADVCDAVRVAFCAPTPGQQPCAATVIPRKVIHNSPVYLFKIAGYG